MKNEEIDFLIKNGFVLTDDKYIKDCGYIRIIIFEEINNIFLLFLEELGWTDYINFEINNFNFIIKLINFIELSSNDVSEYIDDKYFHLYQYKYYNDMNYEAYYKKIFFLNQIIEIGFSKHLRDDESYSLSLFSENLNNEILICEKTNLILLTTLEELLDEK